MADPSKKKKTVDGSWAHMAEEKGEGHADCLPPKEWKVVLLDYGAF
jgi:hypothetical protein